MNHMHQAFVLDLTGGTAYRFRKALYAMGTLEEPWGERKAWWLMRHRAVEVEKIAQ